MKQWVKQNHADLVGLRQLDPEDIRIRCSRGDEVVVGTLVRIDVYEHKGVPAFKVFSRWGRDDAHPTWVSSRLWSVEIEKDVAGMQPAPKARPLPPKPAIPPKPLSKFEKFMGEIKKDDDYEKAFV